MSELLTPKLRFPKFDDNWSTHNLSEISEQIKRKKEDISSEDNILTISANKGFISQKERWDNVIAGGSLKKYTYLKQNEFSYNRGNSKSFKFGCIYKLNNYKNALVPNVYHSFKITYGNTDFFEQLFKSKILDKQLIKMITSTARMDGLLNISAKNFFNINVNFPNDLKEQEKIGSFLKTIDTKIILLEQKYDNYLNFKKYLMQQIFTQKLRFADYIDEWKTIKLKDIGEINTGNTPSTAVDEYYSPKKYLWVTPSDISKKYIFDTAKGLSDEGAKKGRFVKKNSVLVTCIASIGKNCIILEDGYFNQQINSITPSQSFDLEFIYYLIDYNSQKMKNYAGITATPILNKKSFENMKFEFPSFNEQKQIGNILSKVDDKIFSIEEMINKTQKYKKGLLQQMFNNVRLVVINLIINEYICPL